MVDLGLTADQFCALTLRQIHAVFDRHNTIVKAREDREDRRQATMWTMYLNRHRDVEKHPAEYTVDHFLKTAEASEAEAEDNEPATPQTMEDQIAFMRLFTTAYLASKHWRNPQWPMKSLV